jgi:hypothetical protein
MKNLSLKGSAYDATINGVLTLANPLIRCKTTKCMDFNKTTNYLSFANPVTGLTNYSIVFWANFDSTDGCIFSRVGAATCYVYYDGLKRIQWVNSVGGIYGKQANPLSTTVMFAGVNGATSQCYINTKLNAVGVAGVASVDANAYIGQFPGPPLIVDGRLDNMLFYNVALTPDQIVSIYRSANPRM